MLCSTCSCKIYHSLRYYNSLCHVFTFLGNVCYFEYSIPCLLLSTKIFKWPHKLVSIISQVKWEIILILLVCTNPQLKWARNNANACHLRWWVSILDSSKKQWMILKRVNVLPLKWLTTRHLLTVWVLEQEYGVSSSQGMSVEWSTSVTLPLSCTVCIYLMHFK